MGGMDPTGAQREDDWADHAQDRDQARQETRDRKAEKARTTVTSDHA